VGAEKGVTTGRSRRCGWFDAALLKRSAQVNGLTGLCITKLDVLDGLKELKLCTGYELDGETGRHPAHGRGRHCPLQTGL
jgi:adenylosuccinate synthase